MMRSLERHAVILGLLRQQEHVTIEAMAAACDASLQTIRRDLNQLSEDGRVVRYHGGARLADLARTATYEVRSASHVREKVAAGQLLARLIPDGASLFLAGGSTLALAAQELRACERLTVVTNNLHAAVTLYDKTGFDVCVLGGTMRPASGSMIGEDAVRMIERYSLDYAVIGTCGISADGALLEYDQGLVPPILAMIANARQTVLVADGSKFGTKGIVRAANLEAVDHFVTDRAPEGAAAELLARHGVEVHPAGLPSADRTLDGRERPQDYRNEENIRAHIDKNFQ
ncbi:DeoR/GlpR family DNA-binding transcription regulator [Cereibacter azotoformans]|uniref:DeoR family transcriptional regulator n=1 Tax=Cereibacter azotoformans TaxID=43057 RepID=A0A2T5JVP5_9RHOB|nr:DeoR/GlpR family DNA-binding transcription regulator [Cereibacter azotoformans]PTR14245.1 DeoR family transcriptional regulator [Cereibacter azotoformans]